MKISLFFCLMILWNKVSISMEKIVQEPTTDTYGLVKFVIDNENPWNLFNAVDQPALNNWDTVFTMMSGIFTRNSFPLAINIIDRGSFSKYQGYYAKLLQLYCTENGDITTFIDKALTDTFLKDFYKDYHFKVSKVDTHDAKIQDQNDFHLVTKTCIEGLLNDPSIKRLTQENKIFIKNNIETLCCNDKTSKGKNILGFVHLFLQMKYLSHLDQPNIDTLLEKVRLYWNLKKQPQSTHQSAIVQQKNTSPQTWGAYIRSWLSPSAWYEWWHAISMTE